MVIYDFNLISQSSKANTYNLGLLRSDIIKKSDICNGCIGVNCYNRVQVTTHTY